MMMGMSKEFVASHLAPLRHEHYGYELDIRMCQLSTLQLDFHWSLEPNDEPPTSAGRQLNALPSDVLKLNASLNELTALDHTSLTWFVNLRSLDLSVNHISEMCDLGKFRALVNINLSHNRLQVITFLTKESNVVELNLAANEIENLGYLPTLHNLSTLYLSENKLTSLEGIQNLPYLRELHIQRNYIKGLLPLTANRNLSFINASHNRIDSLKTTIRAIENMAELRSLILLGNPIESDAEYQSVLQKKESLLSLDHVMLKKNASIFVLPKETENLGGLKEAARQAFWEQLNARRDRRDDRIRFLQNRIKQLQVEFEEDEERLKADLETTLLQLGDLSSYSKSSIHHPPIWDDEPKSTGQSTQEGTPRETPILPLTREKKTHDYKYKGVTDTDEVLRLASTKLAFDAKHKA